MQALESASPASCKTPATFIDSIRPNNQPIDKIYLYAKDTDEEKYQYLINKREQVGIKNLNDPYPFMEYSNDMNDVLENINNYNKNRDKKVLIIFDHMIAIIRSEKFKAILKELFIRCRKLNISIVFITQSYFRTPKDARLNSTHYILMKIRNKKELKCIAEGNSGHLDLKKFLKMYNYCTKEPYSFMMVDTRPTARVTFKKNFNSFVTAKFSWFLRYFFIVKVVMTKIKELVGCYISIEC